MEGYDRRWRERDRCRHLLGLIIADPRRVAAALQYQQGQADPFDAVPVAGVKQPLTPNEMTWYDRLNNLSAGLGTGISKQIEGYGELIAHPVQSAKDTVQALGTICLLYTSPSPRDA